MDGFAPSRSKKPNEMPALLTLRNPSCEIRQITQEVKTTIDGEGKAANRAGFCPALAEQIDGAARKIDRGTRYRIQVFEELDRDGVQRP